MLSLSTTDLVLILFLPLEWAQFAIVYSPFPSQTRQKNMLTSFIVGLVPYPILFLPEIGRNTKQTVIVCHNSTSLKSVPLLNYRRVAQAQAVASFVP